MMVVLSSNLFCPFFAPKSTAELKCRLQILPPHFRQKVTLTLGAQ